MEKDQAEAIIESVTGIRPGHSDHALNVAEYMVTALTDAIKVLRSHNG